MKAAASPVPPALRSLGRAALGLFLTALVSLLLGAGIDALRRPPLGWRYQPPAERLQAGGRIVDAEQVAAFLEENSVILLDARPAVFYQAGHLPGALPLSREEFARDFRALEARLRAARMPLVVYCADADCGDALRVIRELEGRGFRDVRLYEGGFAEWEADGRPVEAGP